MLHCGLEEALKGSVYLSSLGFGKPRLCASVYSVYSGLPAPLLLFHSLLPPSLVTGALCDELVKALICSFLRVEPAPLREAGKLLCRAVQPAWLESWHLQLLLWPLLVAAVSPQRVPSGLAPSPCCAPAPRQQEQNASLHGLQTCPSLARARPSFSFGQG